MRPSWAQVAISGAKRFDKKKRSGGDPPTPAVAAEPAAPSQQADQTAAPATATAAQEAQPEVEPPAVMQEAAPTPPPAQAEVVQHKPATDTAQAVPEHAAPATADPAQETDEQRQQRTIREVLQEQREKGARPQDGPPAEGARHPRDEPPVRCQVCRKWVTGGRPALIAHIRDSDRCRAARGERGHLRAPCPKCGKPISPNAWAQTQHSWHCKPGEWAVPQEPTHAAAPEPRPTNLAAEWEQWPDREWRGGATCTWRAAADGGTGWSFHEWQAPTESWSWDQDWSWSRDRWR